MEKGYAFISKSYNGIPLHVAYKYLQVRAIYILHLVETLSTSFFNIS